MQYVVLSLQKPDISIVRFVIPIDLLHWKRESNKIAALFFVA